MSHRVDFKLDKNWGVYKKGHVFTGMNRARARSLQDVRKVGKIVKPGHDKADPGAKAKTDK